MHVNRADAASGGLKTPAGYSLNPKRRLRVFIYTAIALAVVVFAFYQYQQVSQKATAAALQRPRPPTPIEVAVAKIEPIPQSQSGIGTLQSVHQVTVAPEVGGRVVKIFFDSGAWVKAGDPLVQLYDAPLHGDLANYQAQAQAASTNLARGKELESRNFQSKQTLEQLQSTLDQAKANIAKTEAQIAPMLIRAPFAGQLGVRQVEVGQYLTPGGPVATLTDLSQLRVNFTLPETAASQIKPGQTVHVRADAYPDNVFDAAVTAVEPQISAQTRTLLVQATLANPEHLLLPGMFANASVDLPNETSAITLPETAVDFTLYGETVYVVKEQPPAADGKAVYKVSRVTVKTGEHFDGKVAILSGVAEGDRVAASGQLKLNEGSAVSIATTNSLSKPPSTSRY